MLVLVKKYQLTKAELQCSLRLSETKIDGLSNKQLTPVLLRRIHKTRALLDALSEIVQLESIPSWMRKSNPAFENRTPLKVIEDGEIDLLWSMVHELAHGSCS